MPISPDTISKISITLTVILLIILIIYIAIYSRKFSAFTTALSAVVKMNADGTYSIIANNNDGTYDEWLHNVDGTFSKNDHIHDDTYSKLDHSHVDLYADKQHAHDDKYATTIHDHNMLYEEKGHNHDKVYAPTLHTHDDKYAPTTHVHSDLLSTQTFEKELSDLKSTYGTRFSQFEYKTNTLMDQMNALNNKAYVTNKMLSDNIGTERALSDSKYQPVMNDASLNAMLSKEFQKLINTTKVQFDIGTSSYNMSVSDVFGHVLDVEKKLDNKIDPIKRAVDAYFVPNIDGKTYSFHIKGQDPDDRYAQIMASNDGHFTIRDHGSDTFYYEMKDKDVYKLPSDIKDPPYIPSKYFTITISEVNSQPIFNFFNSSGVTSYSFGLKNTWKKDVVTDKTEEGKIVSRTLNFHADVFGDEGQITLIVQNGVQIVKYTFLVTGKLTIQPLSSSYTSKSSQQMYAFEDGGGVSLFFLYNGDWCIAELEPDKGFQFIRSEGDVFPLDDGAKSGMMKMREFGVDVWDGM